MAKIYQIAKYQERPVLTEFADVELWAPVKQERRELFVIQYLESVAAPNTWYHVLIHSEETSATQLLTPVPAQQLLHLAMGMNTAL